MKSTLVPPVIPFTRARHVKTGNRYVIIGTGFLEATMEAVVIYRPEDSDTIWVRPYHEFMDGRFVEVEVGE